MRWKSMAGLCKPAQDAIAEARRLKRLGRLNEYYDRHPAVTWDTGRNRVARSIAGPGPAIVKPIGDSGASATKQSGGPCGCGQSVSGDAALDAWLGATEITPVEPNIVKIDLEREA